MTQFEHTADARVLVGIDVSKHRHEVLIVAPGKTRRRRLTITNTLDDFQRLIAILCDYARPVQIGFEATGNYHRALVYQLGMAGFDVKLVSSVALARTREALHNSWDSRRVRGPSGAAKARRRSQRRAGHPAHAPDRRHPGLHGSAPCRDHRYPGAVNDP